MKFSRPRILKYGILFSVVLLSLFLMEKTPSNLDSGLLPSSTSTVATSMVSTSSETASPQAPIITIVAFGDSITAGYGISIPEAYPQLLEDALILKGKNVQVINSGVSGETTAGGLRRAVFVAAQKPDVVIIALGGNDVLRGIDPASTKANLAGIITLFQKNNIVVILAGMKAPTNLGPAYVEEFDGLYPQLAKEYGLTLVPFLLEGVALDASLNQADGIHPNQKGAKIIAEKNILPKVLPLLK